VRDRVSARTTRPMSDLQIKQTYIYRPFVEPPPAAKKT
jgi:hypothetical protein